MDQATGTGDSLSTRLLLCHHSRCFLCNAQPPFGDLAEFPRPPPRGPRAPRTRSFESWELPSRVCRGSSREDSCLSKRNVRQLLGAAPLRTRRIRPGCRKGASKKDPQALHVALTGTTVLSKQLCDLWHIDLRSNPSGLQPGAGLMAERPTQAFPSTQS